MWGRDGMIILQGLLCFGALQLKLKDYIVVHM